MKNLCSETSQQNEAIGRYGQNAGTYNNKWVKTSLLKFAKDSTACWFTTAIYRDNELQDLPRDQYVNEFLAAIALAPLGQENRFSKYISLTAPERTDDGSY